MRSEAITSPTGVLKTLTPYTFFRLSAHQSAGVRLSGNTPASGFFVQKELVFTRDTVSLFL
jgi:hypothetical protein